MIENSRIELCEAKKKFNTVNSVYNELQKSKQKWQMIVLKLKQNWLYRDWDSGITGIIVQNSFLTEFVIAVLTVDITVKL